MFNNTFYPSTPEIIDQLIEGLELRGKKVVEPQGGSGKIVERLLLEGAEVIACEKDQDLVKILQTKCVVIGEDFLKITSDQISHVDAIIMNPPFYNADEHIIHAWNIAPAGCKIRSLCNLQTLENTYTQSRKELKKIVETYGTSEDIGQAFTKADRKSNVTVGIVKLEKPGANYNTEFEGFFMEEDPEEVQVNGLMSYNLVRDIVNRYVGAIKIFDEQLETAVRLRHLTKGFYGKKLGFQVTEGDKPLQRAEFKKGMQKAGWSWIFSKLNMEKLSTKGLKEDINKFVETQEKIPFTMRNIYKMLEMVIATTGSRMDKAVLEVFDRVTRHHDDNKYGLPGWKTNSHYLLTKRFIMPHIITMGYSGLEVTHYSERYDIVGDLIKALCYLTGKNYDDYGSIWGAIRAGKVKNKIGVDAKGENEYSETPITRGQWFEWSFFRIRAYKNGTIHFEFKEEDAWVIFNQRVAKLKGYPLPEKREQTKYQERQNGKKPVEPMMGKNGKVFRKPVILSTITLAV